MEKLIEIWNKLKAAIESGEVKTDDYYRECRMCFNSGWISLPHTDYQGRSYKAAQKCRSCNYWPDTDTYERREAA